MTASMELWKSEAHVIKSRCGFCAQTFDKWQDRADHLAKEFRNGANMRTWKGCRGLDAHVAIYVTNAMPPYLIANESKSPFPFSASNSSSLKVSLQIADYIGLCESHMWSALCFGGSRANVNQQKSMQLEGGDLEYLLPSDNLYDTLETDLSAAYQEGREPDTIGPIVLSTPQMYYTATETSQVNPDATCWEILTLRLGRFARQHIEKHGALDITDEMLQNEARIILYGVADGWEQTAADNPEWLSLFKKAHGIDPKAHVPSKSTLVTKSANDRNLVAANFSSTTPSKTMEDTYAEMMELTIYTDITTVQEIYEDLGVRKSSMLDSSFNVNNFDCESLPRSHPDRSLAFECTLSGTTNVSAIARQLFSKRQSPHNAPTVSGPETTSATSMLPAQAMADEGFGVYEPISELLCLSPGGLCFGENGELGFATHNDSCPWSKKERFWLNESTAASFAAQCTAAGEPVSESANVGLHSFPINEEACAEYDGLSMPPNPVDEDFQFPSWDQLPVDFQNPTTSAGYHSTVPISTTGMDMMDLLATDSSASTVLPWDSEEMNFSMDLDLDLDMDLDLDLGGLGM
jgi:hypothetical protein